MENVRSKRFSIPTIPLVPQRHVRFNTSRADRWETERPATEEPCKLGQYWTATGKRNSAASPRSHPKVIAYTKNHNLGLEVPYRYGSETRKYLPDFIVLVNDCHGRDDPLHLVVEIKGYRREDAKEKKSTMDTYWVPGVNHLATYGRWGFAEFTDIYQIELDFAAKVQGRVQQDDRACDTAGTDREPMIMARTPTL